MTAPYVAMLCIASSPLFVWRFFMADNFEFTPENAVPALLVALGVELLAAGLGVPAIAMAESSLTTTKLIIGGGISLLGIGFAFSGYYWKSNLKPWLGPGFTKSIESVALDFRYWAAFVVVIFIGATVMVITSKSGDHAKVLALSQEMIDVRRDMDRYVMPRRISDTQSKSIIKYLSPLPPSEVEVWYFLSDPESGQYAGDFYHTLEDAKWKVSILPKTDDEIEKEQPNATQGLCIDMWSAPGLGRDPDSKPPNQILEEALDNAGIRVDCGGGRGSPTGQEMVLVVAHHPRTYIPRVKVVPID